MEILDLTTKTIIDPYEYVWKTKKELRSKWKEDTVGIKVAAIAPNAEDFNLAKKGVDYDPYLTDFITGCGGYLSTFEYEKNNKNPLVIRGLGGGGQKALKHCVENNRDFYAIDTGYLQPSTKKEYHRVTFNALQNMGPLIERDFDRLSRLRWKYRKRKNPGENILVCPPSEKVMKYYGEDINVWMQNTIAKIKKYSDRPIVIRQKPTRRERVTTDTIWNALDDAYCLVTYNSIAASEAILANVPAIALAPNAASVICETRIEQIEFLQKHPKDLVETFAAHLSYCQFTSPELRNGTAWRILNESS